MEGVAEEAGWDDPDLSRLVLAVIEAVSNAVEHGCGADLVVHCDMETKRCRLSVSDGGPGPEAWEVRRAELPPSEALAGRGLYILSQIADDLTVDGGILRLTVRRPAAS